VPLVVAVALVASLVGSVGAVTVSRAMEARTDRDALAVTGDPQAYADLLVRLAVTNKSTLEPPRWRYALLFTHPTPLQRLALLDAPG
jgi:STE24 endopeptidase